jgi:hypothetical protein
LDASVPRVTVRTETPLGVGVGVSLDQMPLDAAQLGTALAVDPGAHTLVCAGPRGERCARTFTIAEGEASVVTLAIVSWRG